MTTNRVENAIARFDRIATRIDQREGQVAPAAKREHDRTLGRYGRAGTWATIGAVAVVLGALLVGFVTPIGMIGFVGSAAFAGLLAVVIFILLSFGKERDAPRVTPDLANGPMVDRFDSYLYRSRAALPAPAQGEIDRISALLPRLKETLGRVETLDPAAQDARRLMSIHLPGLLDRYANVPRAFRDEVDGEGVSVEQRLVEGLAAARTKLDEVAANLARSDVAAFETQGRFIQSRYGDRNPGDDPTLSS